MEREAAKRFSSWLIAVLLVDFRWRTHSQHHDLSAGKTLRNSSLHVADNGDGKCEGAAPLLLRSNLPLLTLPNIKGKRMNDPFQRLPLVLGKITMKNSTWDETCLQAKAMSPTKNPSVPRMRSSSSQPPTSKQRPWNIPSFSLCNTFSNCRSCCSCWSLESFRVAPAALKQYPQSGWGTVMWELSARHRTRIFSLAHISDVCGNTLMICCDTFFVAGLGPQVTAGLGPAGYALHHQKLHHPSWWRTSILQLLKSLQYI